MITTYFHPTLDSHPASGLSQVKAALIEPILIVGVAAFWLVALPFVAASLACVRVWDTLVAIKSGRSAHPNPLILRRGHVIQTAPALSGQSPARTV